MIYDPSNPVANLPPELADRAAELGGGDPAEVLYRLVLDLYDQLHGKGRHRSAMDRMRWFRFSWSQSTEIPYVREERRIEIIMSDLVFRDSDNPATAAIELLDERGFATAPDNPPTWTTDDSGSIITLAVAADGMSATATPLQPGVVNVSVSTLDNDGTTVSGATQVTVQAGEAASMDVSWQTSAPTPAPAPAPAPTPAPTPDPPVAPDTPPAPTA